MKRAYIILGMKRSGHHAIAYWIAKNHTEPSMLHNDCCKGWGRKELIPSENRPSNQFEILGNPDDESCIINHIYNIEDFNPDYLRKFDFRTFNKIKDADEVYLSIVLRDPYNWAASCIKVGGGLAKRMDNRFNIWKLQAQLFLKPELHSHIIRINYNNWFSDEKYKEQLAAKFNLPTFDKGVDDPSPRGGGSSFDGMRFKRRASEMKVLERWKYFKGVNSYANLFNDPTHQLSQRIFDFTVPKKKMEKK